MPLTILFSVYKVSYNDNSNKKEKYLKYFHLQPCVWIEKNKSKADVR